MERALDQPLVLPELRTVLASMGQQDAARLPLPLLTLIPQLQQMLGDSDDQIAAFRAAWLGVCAASLRLDHLQDGDAGIEQLPAGTPHAASYHLALSYYVLATHCLSQLPPRIPLERRLQLHTLWSTMTLAMASGQHRDLLASTLPRTFEVYQALAQAKSGAAFALAWGGTAVLLCDDPALIDTMLMVGVLYGTLAQYHDDVVDDADQPSAPATLPRIFAHQYPQHAHAPVEQVWAHVYAAHEAHLHQLIATVPETLRTGIIQVFQAAFGGA